MIRKTVKNLLLACPLLLVFYLFLSLSVKQHAPESAGLSEQQHRHNEQFARSVVNPCTMKGTSPKAEAEIPPEVNAWFDDILESSTPGSESNELAALETSLLNSIYAGLNPEIADFMRLRDAYIKEGRVEDYQRFLEKLPDSYTLKTEALGELAQFYAENSNFPKAFDLIEALRSREPDNARLNYYLADVFLLQGNRNYAISYYMMSSAGEEDPHQFYQLGMIFDNMGEHELADQFTARANELMMLLSNEAGTGGTEQEQDTD